MSRNPYAPPGATVADGDQLPARMKPLAIRRAVFLMWASLAVNNLILILDWRFQISQVPVLVVILLEVAGVALSVWLIVKITAGRNWARIVYLVLLVLGLIVLVPDILGSASRAAHIAGLRMIEVGMDFAAMYLVFLPGREWFHKPVGV
jgi:hypothetical protein